MILDALSAGKHVFVEKVMARPKNRSRRSLRRLTPTQPGLCKWACSGATARFTR